MVFDLYQSSLPEGMYITQHGEIEGTPTKAGNYHINVIATPEAGEEYATMKSFEFTIAEAGPQYTIEIMQVPNKLTYTAGEKLDMTGLRVRIWTPDGYIDSKDGEKLTYSNKALTTLGEQKIKLSYEDAFDVSDWAMAAMQWACGSGMIQGIEKNTTMCLDPQGNAVRCQSAAMIYRFCTEIKQ